MENIDHIAKNSLEDLARNNLSAEGKKHLMTDLITGIAGLAFLAAGLIFSYICKDSCTVPALIYTIGFVIEGAPIFAEAFHGIVTKNFSNAMEILVATAITACYFSGEFVAALLIPTILNISHILEERSIMGGREAIDGLRLMQKTTASLLLEDGKTETVESSSLEPGQKILVRPGEGIPADGVICEGQTNIDQKSLTGEPEPFQAGPGDKVFAGTVNLDGTLTVEVKKKYEDTSFSGILKLLEEAENISVPESRLMDRFMRYYIPLVLSVAAAIALIEKDLSRAIAILVVSCPCGQMLVSSAPMVAALSAATKRGILIKNSKFLEDITGIDTVVFDKTGTLTKGEMSLAELLPAEGYDRDSLLATAASLSRGSAHPVSAAVNEQSGNLDVTVCTDIHEYPGKGTEGKNSDGQTVRFGRRTWLEECGIQIPEGFASAVEGSVSFVSVDGTLAGALGFTDTVREDAAAAVASLEKMGVKRTVILTGDRSSAAEKVRELTGAGEVYAGLLPEEKLSKLRSFRENGTVMAIGDGINDALCLRDANVGIAMGAMGSDLAIQSADIALMNNRLDNIPFTVSLARMTRRIIYENLILSFAVSTVMISLSAFGFIPAVAGALLHNIGAFAVIINSSRLLRHEARKQNE